LVFVTVQVTGTVAPVTAVAVQSRELPEVTVVALVLLELVGSIHTTDEMLVAA
jgi:hypothetical protein